MSPLSLCHSDMPQAAFCLCDGWDRAAGALMTGMGMMSPNALLLNHNTKVNNFMLENGTIQ